ncbi:similar to Saccharomyces cerevisiae YIL140W AXL2 Integral plasma membrane protein required for axial budding in haploid cells, localizes to the incipient bud site and bud neck [Maudiozyma saulgeensis]|uniref:Similar to Saccharomyces cerevisiae YIL140W AXL2 Integral plasma membrane protein required for axial budding in haploid cells, localizes to the incipient bud site and bud neck n=1 Tax=Maudiozyma saulgeensis TaxID=1789683 RepID=A0A1X7R3F0_9SACH|nr:similar to Saccharomyces cerevisiae YIL140W AXL2 Integral plasma membrane protein required for axial budding in haploid cells, localizes to the incipient bud site and bud neck [Kazachstania saulgeensis]
MMSLTTTSAYIVVWLLFQQWFISVVHCTPYEAYPVSKQLPPVARVDESFSFVISNDTYKSNVDKTTQITYNAYDLPTWLSFDSSSRTLSGTPPSSFVEDATNNIQYFTFILQGTDTSDNSSLNETYTLVATSTSSISVADNFNLLALLKNYGNTNGKDALILTPNEIFNVTFDRSSFTNEASITSFYGRTKEYNAPLPSWLFFDSNTLKFSGTAPTVNSAIAPESFFQFTLIATDIDGYTGVQIPFQLVIGAHQLTTSVQNTILINVTDAGSFTYPLPLNYVYFDDNVITSTNLESIVLQDGSPSWVTLTNDTLTGTLDNQTSGGNFSVAIYDNYGDVVYLNFEVLSTKDLFATNSLPNINATRGEWFQYSFLPSQFTSYDNTNVSITYPNTSQSHDWLNFQPSNLTLYGSVPDSFQSLNVGVKAEYESQTQELDFQVIGMSKVLQNTTHHNSTNSTTSSRSSSSSISTTSSISHSSTSSTSSSPATASSSAVPQNKTHSSNKKTVAIACGVVIPVVVIGALIILLLILWRRRRNNDKNNENSGKDIEKSTGPSGKQDIKSPGTITAMHNPFIGDDESQSGSDLSSLREEKLGHHSSNELSSNGNVFSDVFESQSRENLLPDNPDSNAHKKSAFFNPYDRSSSFYMDAEPVNTKSWRHNSTGVAAGNRQSALSLNTVTTADLFNTEIKEDEPMKKDPRKSSLGLRDSVFGTTIPVTSNRNTLSPLTEHTDVKRDSDNVTGIPNSKSFGTESNSSNDDFIPVKKGDDYKWVHSNEPNRRPSKKRFVNLVSEGNVNVGQVNDIEGQEPEMI